MGSIIDHNIVQLGVIVCYAKRQFASLLKIYQSMSQLFSFQNKLDFFLNICRASADILFHSLFEIRESLHRIVEIGDGLMKSLRRIVRKETLKITKSQCTLVKILIIFHLVKTGGILDKQIRSPVLPFFVNEIRRASAVVYNIQSFTLRISSIFQNFLLQPGSNTADILHKPNRILENLTVHFLEDIAFLSILCGKYSAVGLINVTVSKYANFFKLTVEIKAVDHFL